MNPITELLAILWHTLRHGDLRGHLAAWWSVVSGDVTAETRYIVSEGA